MHRAGQAMPSELTGKARLHMADAIGIAVAARQTAVARMVMDSQQALGGNGTSKIIGGGQASPMAAAFVNAALIHILDFDDIHDQGRLHPGAVVIPAALAAADLAGASDDEVIHAVALGFEMICRLGVVCSPQGSGPGSDWFLTQLFGYVAASYVAGRVLRLTDEQLVSGIGFAYMQAAGGKQAGFGVGSNSRAIYPAFAAQGGLQAAILARAGMVGPAQSLDGAANLFKIYLSASLSNEQVQALLDPDRWHFLDVDIKPWPCCRLSHPYISVGMQARRAVGRYPGACVRVAVNASAARLCRPLSERKRPVTLQDAKYSIPFMTAYALVHGAPSLSTLDDAILEDQDVLEMAARIEVDEILPDNPGHPLAVISLIEDGKKMDSHAFHPDDIRLSPDRVKIKFHECLEHAGMGQQAPSVWAAIMEGRIARALAQSVAVNPRDIQ